MYHENFFKRVTTEFCSNYMNSNLDLDDISYCESYEKVDNCAKMLAGFLTKEQKVIFDSYQEAECNLSIRTMELYYQRGFSDAMRLLTGALATGE